MRIRLRIFATMLSLGLLVGPARGDGVLFTTGAPTA